MAMRPIDRIIDIEAIYADDRRLMNMLFMLRNDIAHWMNEETRLRDEARRVARKAALMLKSLADRGLWAARVTGSERAALDTALAYPDTTKETET